MAELYKPEDGKYISDEYVVHKENGNKYKKLGDYLTDTGWVNMNCNSNYGSYGNQNPPQYRRIGNKVFFRGLLYLLASSEPASKLVTTLPADCAPHNATNNPIYLSCFTRGATTLGILNVYNNGEVYAPSVLTTQNYFCNLDGLSYLVD